MRSSNRTESESDSNRSSLLTMSLFLGKWSSFQVVRDNATSDRHDDDDGNHCEYIHDFEISLFRFQ